MADEKEQTELDGASDFQTVYRQELEWIASRRQSSPEWHQPPIDQHLKPTEEASLSQTQQNSLQGDLTGLAISGGGIRSATFALGVLQCLATTGLLRRFDYLSTVSGGGYIGSWLSAWIHREGLDAVEEKLKAPGFRGSVGEGSAAEEEGTEVEPRQVRHLRQYTNFLAAKPSVFSKDGWALIAIYLRNLLLNQLVLVLALLGVVIGARIIIEIYTMCHNLQDSTAHTALVVVAGLVALGAAISSALVVRDPGAIDCRRKYWRMVIIPWCITAFAMTAAIITPQWTAMISDEGTVVYPEFPQIMLAFGPPILGIATLMGGFSVKKKRLLGAFAGLLGGLIGGAVICLVIYVFARVGDLGDSALLSTVYVAIASTLGPPSLLLLLVFISFFHVGIAGSELREVEREWWSAVNSRLMMVAAGWFVLFSVVVVGPWIFGYIINGIRSDRLIESITSASGLVGTILAGVWAGRGDKTGTGKSKLHELLVKITPILFLVTVGMSVATLATWLCYDVYANYHEAPDWRFLERVESNLFTDYDVPIGIPASGALIAAFMTLFFVSRKLGDRIGVNTFTLQSLYGNRLTRCYLGASRTRNNPFASIDFDPDDDLPIHHLRVHANSASDDRDQPPPGPLHIVNTALNREPVDRGSNPVAEGASSAGSEAAIRDRQAESFIFSPLFCGSESTGYCDTKAYSGRVSLGTAVGLSGAAVSPNMGYHTSAPIRVLLTMFNVRLGGWYENPKRIEKICNENRSAGWRLLLSELVGKTTVDDDYVYISDGGHFENVGVYELLRRRCRFILAVDSGPDPKVHDNVGRLVRQARIDFGVKIDILVDHITPDDETGLVQQHFVVGRIRYDAVHTPQEKCSPDDEDFCYDNNQGIIVWIKSGINGDEPADITTYHATSQDFPYQATFDLFYSEAQFEAYRALGEHSLQTLLSGLTFDAGADTTKCEFAVPDSGQESKAKTSADLSSIPARSLFETLYREYGK